MGQEVSSWHRTPQQWTLHSPLWMHAFPPVDPTLLLSVARWISAEMLSWWLSDSRPALGTTRPPSWLYLALLWKQNVSFGIESWPRSYPVLSPSQLIDRVTFEPTNPRDEGRMVTRSQVHFPHPQQQHWSHPGTY
jgi:hypothetical protein